MIKKLLRPFDLDAIKRGESLCYCATGEVVKYLAGPDAVDTLACTWNDRIYTDKVDSFRMAPLAWVEGRPVYPNDKLCWIDCEGNYVTFTVGLTGVVNKCLTGHSRFRDGSIFEDDGRCGVEPTVLYWDRPKVKREGWVNIYPDPSANSFRYRTEQNARDNAGPEVVATIKIEWEA